MAKRAAIEAASSPRGLLLSNEAASGDAAPGFTVCAHHKGLGRGLSPLSYISYGSLCSVLNTVCHAEPDLVNH